MADLDLELEARNEADALRRLMWHYENPAAESKALSASGLPVVGVTSNTIPRELIRAAGAMPCVINPAYEHTADIERFMEVGVFEERVRAIFGAALSGELKYLSLLVIPRTSEQEYKLYLYLREAARVQPARSIPPLYLYDMLHTRSSEAYDYGLERTRHFARQLEDLTGNRIQDADLSQAIEDSNHARHAIRTLLSLRRNGPHLAGTEALALIGPSWFIRWDEYAKYAEQAAGIIGRRESLEGKRLMISGASLNHRRLHQTLEGHGAVVVAEDDWWGSRSAGGDINAKSGDLAKAVFEKYYLDSPSPRLFPFDVADAWFQSAALEEIDGVVFYHPPEDSVVGWDYPRRRHYLDERGIPHMIVRDDARSVTEECHSRIESFVQTIQVRR